MPLPPEAKITFAVHNLATVTKEVVAKVRRVMRDNDEWALADAANRTDGAERPPDFVEGSAAAELRVRIELLRSTLGCSS